MPEKTTKKTKRSAEEPEKKRRKVVNKEEEESDGVDEEQLKLELLRKHFESQFAPLEVETKKTKKEKSKKAEKKVEVEEDDMDDMRSDYGSSGEDDDESSGSDDDSELDELDWEGFGADSKGERPWESSPRSIELIYTRNCTKAHSSRPQQHRHLHGPSETQS